MLRSVTFKPSSATSKPSKRPSNGSSKPLPSIARIWRTVAVFLALEVALLAMVEGSLLITELNAIGQKVVEPTVEAVLVSAGGAVDNLSEHAATMVADTLIASGNFDSVTIIDDFGSLLATSKKTDHEPVKLAELITMLPIQHSYTITRSLPTKTVRPGRLEAVVNLKPLMASRITSIFMRSLAVITLSTILSVLLVLHVLGKLRQGIGALLSLTQTASTMRTAQLKEPDVYHYQELKFLADEISSAIESQRKLLAEISRAEKFKAEILESFSDALSALATYATLFGKNHDILFTNARGLTHGTIQSVLLRMDPLNPRKIKRTLEQSDLDIKNLPIKAHAIQRGVVTAHFQATNDCEAWILQIISIASHNTLILASDVSEVRKLEERDQHFRKLEALGRVSSGVAHEFNNMLGIMMGGVESAMIKIPPDSEAQELLSTSLRAAQRAELTIKRMRQLSLKNITEDQPLDLQDWSTKVIPFLSATLGPAIELKLRCPERLCIGVNAALLDVAVVNLCKNSADAMNDQGKIEINIQRLIDQRLSFHRTAQEGKYCIISVQDNGPGFSENVIADVFEPFFTTKQTRGGTGLGLTSVFQMTASHGGEAWIDTDYNRGARVCILLPLLQPDKWPVPNQNMVQYVPVELPHMSVLIVDDELDLAQIYAAAMQSFNADITICTTIAHARQSLDQLGRVDCAVLDNSLPDGLGTCLARDIKVRFPNAACLLVTGDADSVKDEPNGIDKILQKPVRLMTLIETIGKLVVAQSSEVVS